MSMKLEMACSMVAGVSSWPLLSDILIRQAFAQRQHYRAKFRIHGHMANHKSMSVGGFLNAYSQNAFILLL